MFKLTVKTDKEISGYEEFLCRNNESKKNDEFIYVNEGPHSFDSVLDIARKMAEAARLQSVLIDVTDISRTQD